MCVLCVFCVSELEEDSHDDREAAGAQHLAAHEVDAIEGLPCLPVPLDAASTSTKVIDAAAAIPCTIICCPTRKKTEHIAKHLRDLDVAAEPHHAGLPKEMLAETYAHSCKALPLASSQRWRSACVLARQTCGGSSSTAIRSQSKHSTRRQAALDGVMVWPIAFCLRICWCSQPFF